MRCEAFGSVLSVAFGEFLVQGVDFGVESVDCVVHVLDSWVLGVVAVVLGAWRKLIRFLGHGAHLE